jgi:ABC-type sugar transport system ATPase subunit
MTSVQLNQINHRFAERTVLNGLNLSIDSGSYVVLLGENGSGKTTALRTIAGLLRPDHGSVFLNGRCVDALTARRRRVAMVFQGESLYPHLTVEQNLRFGNDDRDRIHRAAVSLNLTRIMNRFPHQLSGGQARRAAIAKAVASNDSLRLLDEPLGSLDSETAMRLELELRQVHRDVGGTTIHVTHRADEAMRIADKIAVMHDGRLLQYDEPTRIQKHPSSIEVAKVISASALNTFTAVWSDGQLRFDQSCVEATGDWSSRLTSLPPGPCKLSLAVPANKLCPWSIRGPGNFGATSGALVVQTDNARAFAVGSERGWSAILDQNTLHAVEQVAANRGDQSTADTVPHPTTPNRFTAAADDVWLFDRESGMVIH